VTEGLGELTAGISDTSVRRRALFRAGAVAGALLVAGLPTMALAKQKDKDDDDDKLENEGRGRRRFGRFAVTGRAAGGATFRGHIRLQRFEAVLGSPNRLVAHGILSGRFLGAPGDVIATVDRVAFTSDVVHADDPACTILHLVLGPLTLNLLGLVLTIPAPITIDLTAIPGGGLLGDLLCVIDNLLLSLGGLGGILANVTALLQFVTALNNFFNALNRI
jgi:hypothetical protein